MIIHKSKTYIKDYKKKIVNKHMDKELKEIEKIETFILSQKNLRELMNHPLKVVYMIEQKSGDLKEIFTARINSKIRLRMKPLGSYPYNQIEIEEIEFLSIDDKHYKEG